MKVEGIWGVEFAGLDGWERSGTALLLNGRYFAASGNHYSSGKYKLTKDKFSARLRINQYGEARAVFGSKARLIDVKLKGTITKKGEIIARSFPREGDDLGVNLRMTQLEKLKL